MTTPDAATRRSRLVPSRRAVVRGMAAALAALAATAAFPMVGASAASSTFEAEAATVSQGKVDTKHAGYTGSGFVDFDPATGSSVQWTVPVSAASSAAQITFRFANGSGAGRTMAVSVNGASATSVSFANTGAWSTWKTTTVTVPLAAGSNVVKATSSTSTGGPNIDSITVAAAATVAPQPQPQSPSLAEPTPVPSGSWPKNQTAKSALGAYVDGSDYEGFQNWLGRSINYQLVYAGRGSESALRQSLMSYPSRNFGTRTAILSIPTTLEADGSTPSSAHAKSAAGEHDDVWADFGAELRKVAATKGWTFPDGRPRWIFRLNWEASGDWYRHSYVGAEDAFKASFRRMVQKTNVPQVPVSYAVALGSSTPAAMEKAYPGDDVVDIVEVDVYDSWGAYAKVGGDADPARRAQTWAIKEGTTATKWITLRSTMDLAKRHGKAMAVGETGVMRKESGSSGQVGGGDNPDWFPNLARFFHQTAIPAGVPLAYVNLFETDYSNEQIRLMTGHFPKAAAAFKATFK